MGHRRWAFFSRLLGRRGKQLGIDVRQKATDGSGPDDQDRDADEAIEVDEVAAQGFLRDLFLITVPNKNVIAHLHKEPTAGADGLERRLGVQGMPDHIVGSVGDLLQREKLPRLGAGGSPDSVVEPHGFHSHHKNRTALWPKGPEGWNGCPQSAYRS